MRSGSKLHVAPGWLGQTKTLWICHSWAIDGYSRRILWLKVGQTNNDPKVIASYYLSRIRQIGGASTILRGDRGTENRHVAFIQRLLRRNSCDDFSGMNSFMYGRSVSNQRIEARWSFFA